MHDAAPFRKREPKGMHPQMGPRSPTVGQAHCRSGAEPVTTPVPAAPISSLDTVSRPRPARRSPPDNGCGVIVIGAGPGGIACASMLRRAGLDVRVLERNGTVGSSWRAHYDCLRLNTTRRFSSLPGMRLEAKYGRWVARDDYVAYLERCAAGIGDAIQFGTQVLRIDRQGPEWVVTTDRGELRAAAVVVATGLQATPYLPPWADPGLFDGELVHVSGYRNAAPYCGRDVLVVGTGQSAQDVVLDLVRGGAGRVWVSIRTPPLLAPRRLVGVCTGALTYILKHGPIAQVIKRRPSLPFWLADRISLQLHRTLYPDADQHLGRPPGGMMAALTERGRGPTLDTGLLAAIRRGDATVVPAVERLDGRDVVLADGSRIQPHAAILCTGQRTNLAPIVGHLGVLGRHDWPVVHGAETVAGAPDLHFIGFRVPAGQLVDMGIDARAIARRLGRKHRGGTSSRAHQPEQAWSTTAG
jgi:putative flavoprotein involved in K+ transport